MIFGKLKQRNPRAVGSNRRILVRNVVVDGSIEKYKARFVARGFSQKEGIDYKETFTVVSRYTSIESVLALAAVMKWKIHQMDVKTAFFNGVVEEEVYVEKPLSFWDTW